MDPNYSSGEEHLLHTKTRKPYTITKQRERWTEDEHNRFLEALKLYGRAWQRIEEHIGTKTAVQIRSHAQKFFTKLEKEALVRGPSTGQAIDIEIPPPRPKRKPSNPYPRKTSVGSLSLQAGTKDGNHLISDFSQSSAAHVLDLEKKQTLEKQSANQQLEIVKKNQNGVDCAEAFSFSQEALSGPLCSENKSTVSKTTSTNHCNFKEFVPNFKEVVNQDASHESYLTLKASGGRNDKEHDTKQLVGDLPPSETAKLGNYHPTHDKLLQTQKVNELKPPVNYGILSSYDMQAAAHYPRHVPVHIVNGSLEIAQTGASLYGNVAPALTTEHENNASRSSVHHFPPFHSPFTPVQNPQSDCHSLLPIPATFTSLVASALLENPAAHAAASFAARFWPVANVDPSADPHVGKMENTGPSMEALAAATVSAATAWWASQGLLPLCTSFNATCSAAPTITTTMENNEARVSNDKSGENPADLSLKDQQLEPKCSETLLDHQTAVKSPPLSSSESAEGESEKLNIKLSNVDPEQAEAVTKAQDLSKTKDQKLVDRSSCGSNTASSSEVETDALEKHDKEEANEPDLSLQISDSTNRRGRICSNLNESWKEVSEGGRLAFQALFSREVLPQSFASPYCHQKYSIGEDKQHLYKEENERLQIDINSKACGSNEFVEHNVSLTGGSNEGEGTLSTGLGCLKFKARRTGFKPYKRCSVEAKESRVAAASTINLEEGKAPKKMRLEGGASL
ncbi:hypothetical protein DCAR_0207897 [Daucus carota subsp. sativus]|uniref:Uncharacterized protein n=1 Tax=Daucus carota subsp. sativus TaxID=79200 RepID=A0AAF0WFM7_DAUCS|nr:PREDICTED: protein LHY [Daucus carota subsp. sativus]XP_017235002.1 PREDICTED: protein LHY [Daucus carota subsp. sativus]XP_017235003.1 PREDICTED: protein LHY [Daucus carota subsp. sativus]XP_017235004.1 PREDICTED: protein LHY [Daucus carota subsp. sativus]XP_017235005.1 PREDICTED: protein LHY [Daucus carota subsp. sativus]XP_017235007.1 PREDICTED: protein LHY [Daucus carota subsp. sativus]XP_017235008.1 PREDICTED: protein LHY [Daucus carota subsp. sativus]XP_017235009.1 PREDICTED: protei